MILFKNTSFFPNFTITDQKNKEQKVSTEKACPERQTFFIYPIKIGLFIFSIILTPNFPVIFSTITANFRVPIRIIS